MGVRSRFISLRLAGLSLILFGTASATSIHALDGTESFIDDPLPPVPTPVKVDTAPTRTEPTQVAQRPDKRGKDPLWNVAREEGDPPQKINKTANGSDLPPLPPDGKTPAGVPVVMKDPGKDTQAGGNQALADLIKEEEDARRAKNPLDPAELAKRYKGILASDPDNPEAHYRLGICMMKLKENVDGVRELEKAVLIKPNNARYCSGLGRACLQTGDYLRAVDACSQAAKSEPANPYYRNVLGNVYLRAGGFENIKSAAVVFSEAVQLEPTNPNYLHNLARALSIGGSHDRALEVMNEVINLAPEMAEAYNDRATLYQALGDQPKALSDFKSAIRLKPDYVQGHVNVSLFYSNEKTPTMFNKQAALDHAEIAVRLTERKNAICLMTLAEAYRANRKMDDAIKTAKEAISYEPSKEYLDRLARYEKIKSQPINNNERTTIIRSTNEQR